MSNSVDNANMMELSAISYPGRGIVIGMTPDEKNIAQVYFIMGRSENSRNRIFTREEDFVKTQAFDESKVTDPSLIIYYPVKSCKSSHIVTNGDQTDTIYDFLQKGSTFEAALNTRTFEPDPPHFTPRISGISFTDDSQGAYKLSILKSTENNSQYCQRHYFNYENYIPGRGHLIHTYAGDGNPLPTFGGEPRLVELYNDIEKTAQVYWNMLDTDNRISLLVKFIDRETGKINIKIINKHQ